MNAKDTPLDSVLIAGSGYAPYLIALTLKQCLPRSAHVQVLEISEPGDSNAVLSSTGHWRALHGDLGIDEQFFLLNTQAQPSLGSCLRLGGSQLEGFMLCDSEYGFLLRGKPFNKVFAQFQKSNPAARLDEFCLQAVIARKQRFLPGSDDPQSLFNLISYGYSVPARSYAAFLKQLARSRGILISSGGIASVVTGEVGIEAVVSASGARLEASLYLDCSCKRILARTLSGVVELGDVLPSADRSITANAAENAKPYTDLTATTTVLRKTYSLASATIEEVLSFGSGCKPWRSATYWVSNCVALAGAARQIPLAVLDDVYLLQADLRRLLDFWPRAQTLTSSQSVYNKIVHEWTQQVIDVENVFFSEACKATSLTENNQHRLSLFREVGRLPSYERDVLDAGQWTALLHALGVHENGFEEDLSGDNSWINVELSKIRSTFISAAESAPTFTKVLNQLTKR